MALVPLTIDVEEVAFIPVVKVLNALPGVAEIHFHLDQIGGKRGGKRGPRVPKTNGGAAETKRSSVRDVAIQALVGGRKTYSELREAVRLAGFSQSSLANVMGALKSAGIAEGDKLHNWSLTETARAKIEAAEGETIERAALPAPASEPPRQKKQRIDGVTAHTVIVAALRQEEKPMARLALQAKIVIMGFSKEGIDGALAKAKSLGWIENQGPGVHKLTRVGRRLELKPEAFPPALKE